MMISKRFSPEVTAVLSLSRDEALRLYNDKVTPATMMLGILRQGQSHALEALNNLGVDTSRLRQQLEQAALKQGGNSVPASSDELAFDAAANRIMKLSVLESVVTRSETIDVIHLLLGILREAENEAAKALAEQNVTYQNFSHTLFPEREVQDGYGFAEDEDDDDMEDSDDLKGEKTRVKSDELAGNQTPVLDKFGTD
ncbi:MAG: hypothetical protein J5510_07675, partial [Prevotella sp.]|nr:hypothetical protein [Prevotella sp.]